MQVFQIRRFILIIIQHTYKKYAYSISVVDLGEEPKQCKGRRANRYPHPP